MQDIIEAIKISAIKIAKEIKKEDRDYSQNTNSTGDNQLKIDILSDIIIEEELKKVTSIYEIVSEEKDDVVAVNPDGIYKVGYDPLDGSSLIDVNLSVGSIFAIYKNSFNGQDLVGAVYVVYGPRMDLVIAIDDVKLYRFIEDDFKYVKNLTLDERGKYVSTGATQKNWLPWHKKLVDKMFDEGYELSYSGGMVPDLHFLLLRGGGLFSYPATIDKPKSKLRMVFEIFPYAYIFEKAGGGAIDGTNRVLDLKPTFVHDTCPSFFGSNYEIELVKKAYNL